MPSRLEQQLPLLQCLNTVSPLVSYHTRQAGRPGLAVTAMQPTENALLLAAKANTTAKADAAHDPRPLTEQGCSLSSAHSWQCN